MVCHLSEWSWARGSWREGPQGIRDIAPWPDGLFYSFCANSPPAWTSMVDDLAEVVLAGAESPSWLLDSVTTFIPKGDASTSTDNFNMTASELRPITLMQSPASVLVYQTNRALATIVESSVVAPQRGFVRNRSIADNVLEFVGKLHVLSQWVWDPAGLLLGFQAAFPSIGHGWLWVASYPSETQKRCRTNARQPMRVQCTTSRLDDRAEFDCARLHEELLHVSQTPQELRIIQVCRQMNLRVVVGIAGIWAPQALSI